MKIRTYAKVRTIFRTIHNWPGCDIKDVNFLKNLHHHEFKITVWVEQFHDNRDIEYIMFQRWLDKQLCKYKKMKNKSCEMLALCLKKDVEKKYPGRDVKVEINEDGYYGAYLENDIVESDLAWLAGFIDGEGYFGMTKSKRKKGTPVYCFGFSVANSNRKVMQRCKQIIKDHLDLEPKIYTYKDKKYNWRDRYQLQLTSMPNMLAFCRLIFPFIYGKKKQVELMICTVEARLDYNSRVRNTKDREYGKEFLEAYDEFKRLNARGGKYRIDNDDEFDL